MILGKYCVKSLDRDILLTKSKKFYLVHEIHNGLSESAVFLSQKTISSLLFFQGLSMAFPQELHISISILHTPTLLVLLSSFFSHLYANTSLITSPLLVPDCLTNQHTVSPVNPLSWAVSPEPLPGSSPPSHSTSYCPVETIWHHKLVTHIV